jgi:hypothetical protein
MSLPTHLPSSLRYSYSFVFYAVLRYFHFFTVASVFNKLKLGPEASARTIVEGAKLRAGEVVQDIARIPVVGDVENSYAYSSFILLPAKRNLHTLRYQQIER